MKIPSRILSCAVLFISLTNLTAQTNAQLASSEKTQEKVVGPIPREIKLPTEKKEHPEGYYDGWVSSLEVTENAFRNKDWRQGTRTMHHWNRFLDYFKMVPDEPSQILVVFMDAYSNDKHSFCSEYDEWIPRLTSGDMGYCLEYYRHVKPAMDEIVRLVMDSYDKELIEQFKKVLESDQRIRANIPDNASLEKQKELLSKQHEIDLKNLEIIESVIAEHGYPGRSHVGIKYEEVAFLVIQHSGSEVIEKYLPLIKTAIDKKDLAPKVYPYLFDRLEVSNGRPQHFGTQSKLETNELFPIHEPNNVNKRRAKYGLPAIKANKINNQTATDKPQEHKNGKPPISIKNNEK